MGVGIVSQFSYYSDGEYEYRIERHEADSAARFTGKLGLRVWSLVQRPVMPQVIVIQDARGAHDGSYCTRRGGPTQPPRNAWEKCGRVYLDNATDEPAAALRLLGKELREQCTEAVMAKAAAKRFEHSSRWG